MIFIVEDDDATRESLRLLLDSEKLPTQVFATCEEFLRMAPALDGGCLIVDVHMPGMSGLDLLERVRAAGSRVPAIVVTGNASGVVRRRALALDAAAVVEKPYDADVLVALAKRIVA
jgi:two-component system response regulator FixJ